MSTATSVAARQVYGVQRVCAAWGFPRASFYASAPLVPPNGLAPAAPGKRGPKTVLDDAALLALIRADLAASPFIGEGHRKGAAKRGQCGQPGSALGFGVKRSTHPFFLQPLARAARSAHRRQAGLVCLNHSDVSNPASTPSVRSHSCPCGYTDATPASPRDYAVGASINCRGLRMRTPLWVLSVRRSLSPVMMTSTCAANAIGVLELVDRFLELVVEDGAIDDDGDGVKLLCALRGVERGELVGDPADGVRFAGAGAVLDEVFLGGTFGAGGFD